MISNAADGIATIVNKLIIEVRETEEEFVWTQVEPWLSRTMERHISKRELVEALQKQTPRPPYRRKHDFYVGDLHFDGGYSPCCPTCNKFFQVHGTYCPYCGQKIDWGDGE